MQGDRTDNLLRRLNELCKDGGFRILEGEELGQDEESVKEGLDALKERGYLEVEYAEGGEYCVRLLAEGRRYLGQEEQRRREEGRRQRRGFFLSVAGGFLGALAGGAAVALFLLISSC